MYYWYHLFQYLNQVTAVYYVGKFAQKYIVNIFAIINQEYLNWIWHHQNQICADLYNCVTDFVWINDLSTEPPGQKVVLSALYTDDDWYMSALYQNSMTIVQHFGKPTLFVIMTANSKWSEIVNELASEQTAQDNPVLITIVFNLKQKMLLKDLREMFRIYQDVL